jgi:hypothetical protein
MKYGYVRVSTLTQNISRQMEEMYKYNLTDKEIFVDKFYHLRASLPPVAVKNIHFSLIFYTCIAVSTRKVGCNC